MGDSRECQSEVWNPVSRQGEANRDPWRVGRFLPFWSGPSQSLRPGHPECEGPPQRKASSPRHCRRGLDCFLASVSGAPGLFDYLLLHGRQGTQQVTVFMRMTGTQTSRSTS